MRNRHLYPDNWEVIRHEVLKRDNYTCTEIGCKIKHGQFGYYNHLRQWIVIEKEDIELTKSKGIKVKKMGLQVAHLDQNKNNCTLPNLKAMCPAHHLNYDRYFNNLKRKMPGRQQLKTKDNF